MTSITSLPNELLVEISRHLNRTADLSSLSATSRRFHFVVNPILYSFAAVNYPDILSWACEAGKIEIVKKLLKARQSPNVLTSNSRDLFLEDLMGIEWIRDMTDTRAVLSSIISRKQRVVERRSRHNTDPPTYNKNLRTRKRTRRVRKYLRLALRNFWFPLHSAAIAGSTELVKLLVDYGALLDVPAHAIYNCQPRYHRKEIKSEFYYWTPLHTALCCGNEAVANMLISLGASTNVEINKRKSSALHWAARGGYLSTIRLLLEGEQKVPVDIQDTDGATPLMWALGTPHSIPIMKCLLRCGANMEARTNRRCSGFNGQPTALLRAIRCCWYEEAFFLINSGANIHPPTDDLPSALDQCLISLRGIASEATAEKLFYLWPDMDDRKHKQFCRRFGLERDLGILSKHTDFNDIYDEEVHSGMVELAKKLICMGANVHGSPGTRYAPLVRASGAHLATVVDLLIKYGAQVNQEDGDGLFPLLAAVLTTDTISPKSCFDTVECLLKNGANPNKITWHNRTVIMAICSSSSQSPNDLEIIKLLVEYGADINARNVFQMRGLAYYLFEKSVLLSPLQAALCTHKIDICRYLIDIGAEDSLEMSNIDEVLQHLVQQDSSYFKSRDEDIRDREQYCEVFKLLFEIDHSGWLFRHPKALWMSTVVRCFPLTTILLQNGASDASWVNKEGETCLHNMAFYGFGDYLVPTLIPRLIANGADVNKLNNEGCSPFSYILLSDFLDDCVEDVGRYVRLFTVFIENGIIQTDHDVEVFELLVDNLGRLINIVQLHLFVELSNLFVVQDGKIVARETPLHREVSQFRTNMDEFD
ncbi:ankyrin [Daldinia decipiens]|uniref:ankyrin n=1 Tax=Daldinia decipiens TaxID=326647 RepID=UPI0020C59E80|nr:ankyrin [Daldinia decipiens]KAI1653011.1 ankyrin [Daldinia decipiens]